MPKVWNRTNRGFRWYFHLRRYHHIFLGEFVVYKPFFKSRFIINKNAFIITKILNKSFFFLNFQFRRYFLFLLKSIIKQLSNSFLFLIFYQLEFAWLLWQIVHLGVFFWKFDFFIFNYSIHKKLLIFVSYFILF